MSFAFGGLGLGILLMALISVLTRQAWFIGAADLALSVFALWETYGRFRKNAALFVGYALVALALISLFARTAGVFFVGNLLLGLGFIGASAKYHYEHAADFPANDFLGRQWGRIAT